MGDRERGRPPGAGAVSDHGDRASVRADHADDPWRGELPRRVVSHRQVAARAGELRGQARRGDRHRSHWRAGHHRDRQDGRPPHGVPANAQLVCAAPQQQDRRGHPGPDQVDLCRDLRALPRFVRLLHPPGRPAQGDGGERGGARGALREALRRAGLRHLDGQLPGRAGRSGRQRHHHRVHAPEDPRARRWTPWWRGS